MAIILSKNGKKAVKINRTAFGLEENIQQYIYDNPESIPLYDIKEDIQLLILAREFSTQSGYIDALGIDKEGEIYLIETKLYRNPDKRTVVAQVLDYGAALWKAHTDFDSFILQINNSTQKTWDQSAREKIQTFYSLNDEEVEAVLTRMSENLNGGNFKFVVLMDTMHDQLKDLILYMNQNSKFDIYGVEVEYYKHEEYEIIIPKLFGAEVKKDVVSKNLPSKYITDEEFVEAYSAIGLGNKIQEILQIEKDFKKGMHKDTIWYSGRTPKTISFVYLIPGKNGLFVSVGFTKGSPSETIDIWLYEKSIEEKVLTAIGKVLEIPTRNIADGSSYGVIARWPLKDFTREKMMALFKAVER